MTSCSECGASGRSRSCEELFQVVLALDHSRREPRGPLHGVTVACFLLQHPTRLRGPDLDRPWATLHVYLDEGVTGLVRFAASLRRVNSHRNGRAGHRDVVAGVPVPPIGPRPAAFAVTIEDVAADGAFPAEGFGRRVTAWAAATADAWRLDRAPGDRRRRAPTGPVCG